MPKWRNGRREGLKNLWALARVGSNPTFGTNTLKSPEIRKTWMLRARLGNGRGEWCRGATPFAHVNLHRNTSVCAVSNLNAPEYDTNDVM